MAGYENCSKVAQSFLHPRRGCLLRIAPWNDPSRTRPGAPRRPHSSTSTVSMWSRIAHARRESISPAGVSRTRRRVRSGSREVEVLAGAALPPGMAAPDLRTVHVGILWADADQRLACYAGAGTFAREIIDHAESSFVFTEQLAMRRRSCRPGHRTAGRTAAAPASETGTWPSTVNDMQRRHRSPRSPRGRTRQAEHQSHLAAGVGPADDPRLGDLPALVLYSPGLGHR